LNSLIATKHSATVFRSAKKLLLHFVRRSPLHWFFQLVTCHAGVAGNRRKKRLGRRLRCNRSRRKQKHNSHTLTTLHQFLEKKHSEIVTENANKVTVVVTALLSQFSVSTKTFCRHRTQHENIQIGTNVTAIRSFWR